LPWDESAFKQKVQKSLKIVKKQQIPPMKRLFATAFQGKLVQQKYAFAPFLFRFYRRLLSF